MKRDARLKSMTSSEIRGSFLEFFRKNGHAVLPSSSLVPGNDPTLLFTNAGMVQFKDLFLGKEVRDYSRAATAQALRARRRQAQRLGKCRLHRQAPHILRNAGQFQLRRLLQAGEAIHFAWNFITGTLGIPKERLWVTVFEEDDEAERIWTEEIGIGPARWHAHGRQIEFLVHG